ncbi:MAG: hypothetical protein HFG33_02775 [Bacilli bacterium]|nr:hypothetical protein [Bacilli bacterium]
MGKIKRKLTETAAGVMALLQLTACGFTNNDIDTKLKDKKEILPIEESDNEHDHSHGDITIGENTFEEPTIEVEKSTTPSKESSIINNIPKTDGSKDSQKEQETPAPVTEKTEEKTNEDGWVAIDDENEKRVTENGKEETQAHSYKIFKVLSYIKNNDGTHYELRMLKCETCGHVMLSKVKADCEYQVDAFDKDREYQSCTGCHHLKFEKHHLGTGIVNRDGTITKSCLNEGCDYTYTYTPSTNVRPGGGSGGGSNGGGSSDIEKPGDHVHRFGEWTSLNDKEEHRTCECGKEEKRAHKFVVENVKFEDFSNSLHIVITTEKCVNCNHNIVKKSYSSHNLDEGKLSEDGKFMIYTCKDCGHVKRVPVAEVEHIHDYQDRQEIRSNSNGTHTIYTIYTCTNTDGKCDKLTYEVKGDTLDCNFNDGVLSEDGKFMIYTCKDCGHIKRVPVAEQEHTHNYKVTGTGVTDNGNGTHTPYTDYTCDNKDGKCDNITYRDTKDPVNCALTENVVTNQKYDNAQHYDEIKGNCICGHEMSETKNAESHNLNTGNKIFTHDANSYCYSVESNCTDCGYSERKEVDHDFQFYYEDDKDIYKSCFCGEELIESKGHKHNYISVSGIKDNGNGTHTPYTTYTCENKDNKCDEITYTEKGNTISCSMTENINSNTSYDSSQHYTEVTGNCACGHSMSEKQDAESHNLNAGNRDYTGDADSYCYSITTSCTDCGYSDTQTVGHTFKTYYEDDTTIYQSCVCGVENEISKNVAPVVPVAPIAPEIPTEGNQGEQVIPEGNGQTEDVTVPPVVEEIPSTGNELEEETEGFENEKPEETPEIPVEEETIKDKNDPSDITGETGNPKPEEPVTPPENQEETTPEVPPVIEAPKEELQPEEPKDIIVGETTEEVESTETVEEKTPIVTDGGIEEAKENIDGDDEVAAEIVFEEGGRSYTLRPKKMN